MENVFRGFKDQIEEALGNSDIPREARLIILGQLLFAKEIGEITPNEYRKLEALLGKPEEFREARQLAHDGKLLKPRPARLLTAEDFDYDKL